MASFLLHPLPGNQLSGASSVKRRVTHIGMVSIAGIRRLRGSPQDDPSSCCSCVLALYPPSSSIRLHTLSSYRERHVQHGGPCCNLFPCLISSSFLFSVTSKLSSSQDWIGKRQWNPYTASGECDTTDFNS